MFLKLFNAQPVFDISKQKTKRVDLGEKINKQILLPNLRFFFFFFASLATEPHYAVASRISALSARFGNYFLQLSSSAYYYFLMSLHLYFTSSSSAQLRTTSNLNPYFPPKNVERKLRNRCSCIHSTAINILRNFFSARSIQDEKQEIDVVHLEDWWGKEKI